MSHGIDRWGVKRCCDVSDTSDNNKDLKPISAISPGSHEIPTSRVLWLARMRMLCIALIFQPQWTKNNYLWHVECSAEQVAQWKQAQNKALTAQWLICQCRTLINVNLQSKDKSLHWLSLVFPVITSSRRSWQGVLKSHSTMGAEWKSKLRLSRLSE